MVAKREFEQSLTIEVWKPCGRFAPRCTSLRFVCVENRFMVAKREFEQPLTIRVAWKICGSFLLLYKQKMGMFRKIGVL